MSKFAKIGTKVGDRKDNTEDYDYKSRFLDAIARILNVKGTLVTALLKDQEKDTIKLSYNISAIEHTANSGIMSQDYNNTISFLIQHTYLSLIQLINSGKSIDKSTQKNTLIVIFIKK